jgi:branched-chain amino acid transport system substrate-binding protein
VIHKRKAIVSVACAFTAALGVAACSSSSKPAATTPTSASQSTSGSQTTSAPTGSAQPTGAPIKVGLICDCTGPLGSTATDEVDVYKAFIDATNAAGGIEGHPIQLSMQDDQSNPANAQQDVQTLIQSDHVIALVDMTNLDETWASYAKTAGVPVIGGDVSTTPMMTNSDFYPEGQTENALFPSIIDAAKGAGASNLALFYCAEAVQCHEGIAPLVAVGKQLGLPVSFTAEVAVTAPNYTAQCLAAEQAHITGLFIADVANVIDRAASDCNQQGYKPTYVIDGLSLEDGQTTSPGLEAGMVAPSANLPFYATTTSAVQAMDAALNKYYPGIQSTGSIFTEIAAEAWPSGLLLEDAAKAGNIGATPTSAELVAGLAALKGDTLDGWAPPLTFASGQPHTVNCWFTAGIKSGQWVLPDGTQTTCANA